MKAARRPNPGNGSQASLAYDAIRADILCGCHLPNTKLKVHELAQELGISPGAVREALFRLISEHLVEARDQRGFVVAPVSIEDLKELTDLRCEIESIACRRSVELGGLEWEGGLVAAQYRLRATAERSSEDGAITLEWLAAHAAFHEALTAAAGNARLLSIRAQLYEQYQRFRAFYTKIAGERQVGLDHDELVELALARNATGLVSATVTHLRKTTEQIICELEQEQKAQTSPRIAARATRLA